MSRNSWVVGTGAISFHVVFIVGNRFRCLDQLLNGGFASAHTTIMAGIEKSCGFTGRGNFSRPAKNCRLKHHTRNLRRSRYFGIAAASTTVVQLKVAVRLYLFLLRRWVCFFPSFLPSLLAPSLLLPSTSRLPLQHPASPQNVHVFVPSSSPHISRKAFLPHHVAWHSSSPRHR